MQVACRDVQRAGASMFIHDSVVSVRHSAVPISLHLLPAFWTWLSLDIQFFHQRAGCDDILHNKESKSGWSIKSDAGAFPLQQVSTFDIRGYIRTYMSSQATYSRTLYGFEVKFAGSKTFQSEHGVSIRPTCYKEVNRSTYTSCDFSSVLIPWWCSPSSVQLRTEARGERRYTGNEDRAREGHRASTMSESAAVTSYEAEAVQLSSIPCLPDLATELK
nr:hypothetical protein CFP56_08072 [Quercus suber]